MMPRHAPAQRLRVREHRQPVHARHPPQLRHLIFPRRVIGSLLWSTVARARRGRKMVLTAG
jgi:hypothetical protein